jgi:methionine synthase I (cobalamin-dependent)
MSDRVNSALLNWHADRVVVADGGMGTALPSRFQTPDDLVRIKGWREILDVTRPEVVRVVDHGPREAGADAIETNTSGPGRPRFGFVPVGPSDRSTAAPIAHHAEPTDLTI